MKKIWVTFSVWFVATIMLLAQNDTVNVVNVLNEQTGKEIAIELPEAMSRDYDGLLKNWHIKNYLMLSNEDCENGGENPIYGDSVYATRLARIPSIVEMPYNAEVRKMIDIYSGRLRNKVAYMLGAMNFYMPIFEEALDMYDLPNELKYLPVIESALNPVAVSRAGASGLWQFMLKTGKIYDLQSNSLIDERRDPIKSTYAAARYLKELYGIYNDWSLVIAAYNCGPGNINKAIQRSGGKADYWAIYNYLPKETRGYVPAFIAANYIMTYYCEHNICPLKAELPAGTDTIQIHRDLHFQQISDVCKIELDEIRALNPQYKRDIIPGNSMECTLRLPREAVTLFINSGDSTYAYRAKEFFKKRQYVDVKSTAVANSSNGKLIYHKIRRGETLSKIARKYGVTVKKIRKWNGLNGNSITAGKRLKIYR